jgi:hypothetical protein
MKPFEILSAIPAWSEASPDEIVDSPAFALPCKLGDGSATLRFGAMRPADPLRLAILLEDEPHVLGVARSSRFKELDAIWDSMADVPEAIALAIAEKELGPVFQLVENAARRQLKVVGLSDAPADESDLCAQVEDIVFTLTRSKTFVKSIGLLRNIDVASEHVRSMPLKCEAQYAAFVLGAADTASIAPGDYLLLPEIGTLRPKLIVDGRFVLDESGVVAYVADNLATVRDAESREITLGEVFDSVDAPRTPPAVPPAGIRLVKDGRTIANGHLGNLGDQNAFVVEAV